MRLPHGFWKELQLHGWMIFLAYMILTGKDLSYLAPLQHQILLAGGAVLFLALMAGFFAKRPATLPVGAGGGWRAFLESSGHWVPFLVVMLMGVTTLNMDLASLRNGIQMRVMDPDRVPEDPTARLAHLRVGEYLETTHIQLYGQAVLAADAPVSLIGRLARLNGEQFAKAFPTLPPREESHLLYRFAIACCAADATPLTVLLEGVPADAEVGREGWYRVRGVTRTTDETGPIVVRIDRLEPIPAPEKPFLSWLDVY
ncbi:hypothetical protein SIID45300_02590 [Candidatus Magnetaquicoccaceae bacterium FCR-1]|uniref:DUF1980 domain-containing protein n=1 Tax=Candidatus Magnetaquiglobus chichijimensis TaxID=3141448 RepID=A0ABQ0CBH5_9PROT